jgi:hypothetical protein
MVSHEVFHKTKNAVVEAILKKADMADQRDNNPALHDIFVTAAEIVQDLSFKDVIKDG